MKKTCVLVLVLMTSSAYVRSVHAQEPTVCKDGSSTLKDFLAPADTMRAEQFLTALQTALAANDKAKIAGMVQYPLRVNLAGQTHRLIRNRQQFAEQFAWLFTDKTREAVKTQIPACMFARDQGVMIGNGEIWFQDFDGTFRIDSFNRM